MGRIVSDLQTYVDLSHFLDPVQSSPNIFTTFTQSNPICTCSDRVNNREYSGADYIGHGARPPLLQIDGHGGTIRPNTNDKQETDQTVLTILKALTKTTDCTCRAEKVEGHDKKIFSSAGREPPQL